MFLAPKYSQSIKKLLSSSDLIFRWRGLFATYIFTASAKFVNEMYTRDQYSRAGFARRILNHAVGPGIAAQNKDRSKVKRDIMMPFMKSARYDILFESIYTNFQHEIDSRSSTFNLSEALQHAVSCAMLTEHFGIELTEAQKKRLLEDFIPLPDHVKNSKRLFAAKFFKKMPLFIEKIILGSNEQYTIRNQQISRSFFEYLYQEGINRPGSLVEALVEAYQNGVITYDELIGEYGSTMGSAYTLTESLISSCVFLAKYTDEQTKTGNDFNHAKHAFLETLRLRASFPTLAYEEVAPKSKCPFHFWQRKNVIIVSVLELQSNTKYWGEDAEEFRPDRFAAGLSSFEKGAFIPFGGGERRCPASGMTMTVGSKFIHSICKDYKFTLISKEPELKKLFGLHRVEKPIFFKFEKK